MSKEEVVSLLNSVAENATRLERERCLKIVDEESDDENDACYYEIGAAKSNIRKRIEEGA